MNCWSCGAKHWAEFGPINPEHDLLCCKECGAVAYRVDPEKEESVKDYYRVAYRPAPNIMNLVTTAHKRAYIEAFLSDFMKDRTPSVSKGIKPMICGDVGCATGYIPHWLRSLGHKATGCELTVTYRRFAEHFYSVPVTEELETKHKYDLITIYHVLEHLMEPDKKLAHYVSLLADDGHILVSVPEWLDTLEEASGSVISDFKTLFHKDHINVFTQTSLKNVFARAGLIIVKEDHHTYGQTYLLKKGETAKEVKVEDYKEVMEKVRRQKDAINLFLARKYDEALSLWPKFPDAWIKKIHEDFTKDRQKQADGFAKAFEALPNNLRLRLSYATWLYMGEELEEAIKYFHDIIRYRPNEDIFIFMGWAYSKLKKENEAMQWFAKAAEMNPMKWGEAMNAIAKCAVSLPCWEERAMEEAKQALFAQAKPKAELQDPVMEKVVGETTKG